MRALHIQAGPVALQHLQAQGLAPQDITVMPGAAGGPKGLILGPLDRFIFGDWLPSSNQAVDLVGASIGAWRLASACLNQTVEALQRLEHDYIHQHYEIPAGQRRPSAAQVSQEFGQSLQAFYGARIAEISEGEAGRSKRSIVAARSVVWPTSSAQLVAAGRVSSAWT